LDARRLKMSIIMVPVKSSNVRAVGLDAGGARLLVQFDGGVYECVYRGQAGTSTAEGREAWVKGTYERFIASESKGRFYNEQIRRQADVWRVRKLDDHLIAQVHEGGRATIEPEQIDEPKMGGVEKYLADEKKRAQEFMDGKDFTQPPQMATMLKNLTELFDGLTIEQREAFERVREAFEEVASTHVQPTAPRDEGATPVEELIEELKTVYGAVGVEFRERTKGPHGFEQLPDSVTKLPSKYCGRCGEGHDHRLHRTLILTVGLPRSGKSSWARVTGFPIVSPDAIRLGLHGRAYEQLAEPFVWAQARLMVRSLFVAGHETVILDACNVTRARRDEWRGAEWETVCQVFEATREEARQRVFKALQDPQAAPADQLTPLLKTIDRMSAAFEPLGDDEPRYEGVCLDISPLTVGALDPSSLTAAGRALLEQEMYLKTGPPREVVIWDGDDIDMPGGKDGQS
jgi:predicted kinase